MKQIEHLSAVITEQLSKSLPQPRSPEENQVLVMIKKATYSAFIIGYKTARDSIAKDMQEQKLLTDDQIKDLLLLGEDELDPIAATGKGLDEIKKD